MKSGPWSLTIISHRENCGESMQVNGFVCGRVCVQDTYKALSELCLMGKGAITSPPGADKKGNLGASSSIHGRPKREMGPPLPESHDPAQQVAEGSWWIKQLNSPLALWLQSKPKSLHFPPRAWHLTIKVLILICCKLCALCLNTPVWISPLWGHLSQRSCLKMPSCNLLFGAKRLFLRPFQTSHTCLGF